MNFKFFFNSFGIPNKTIPKKLNMKAQITFLT